MPTPNRRRFEANGLMGPKPKAMGSPRPLTASELGELEQIRMAEEYAKRQGVLDLDRRVDAKIRNERADDRIFDKAISLGWDALKVVDPYGISSYPDVAKAWGDEKFTYKDITEPLGALPLLSVFGKAKNTVPVISLSKNPASMVNSIDVLTRYGQLQRGQRYLNYVQGVDDVAEDLDLKSSFRAGGSMDDYQSWRSKLPRPLQYEGDYNLRGLWESNPGVEPSDNLHFTDEFKLPNHPTYSTESRGWASQPWSSGIWSTVPDGPGMLDVYTPFDPSQKVQVVEPHQFNNGGSMNKKFRGKKANYGLGIKPGDTQYPYQTDMTPLEANPMQPLPVSPAAQMMQPLPMETPMGAQQTGMQTMAGRQPRMGGGRSFTTPGTGDLISGLVGAANALMPEQTDDRRQRQYGNYNPNAWGTGSSALYEEGGMIGRPTYNKQFTSGGFRVNQETPRFFEDEVAPLNSGMAASSTPQRLPVPTPATPRMDRTLSYENLSGKGGVNYVVPKFQGPWSRQDIDSTWNSIPNEIDGVHVAKGQEWSDLQFRYNTPRPPSGGTYASRPAPTTRYMFRDGGSLNMGDEVELTEAEIAMYKRLGYKFA